MPVTNNIQLITKYSTNAWDEVYKKEGISSMLSSDKSRVRFSMDNARIVKIFKMSLGALHDYERNNEAIGGAGATAGYKSSAYSGKWETRELSQDRAASYAIEKFDDEETAGLTIASATVEIARTIVVPEVDAYCFSTIAKEVERFGLGNYVDASINTSAPLAAMNAGFKWLADHEVPENNQIAFVSTDYINNLRSTPELYRRLDVEGATDKKVSFKIVGYEGRELVVVPPARFQTGYTKGIDGEGYTFTGKPIDFIVMDKGAAVHVVKYEKQKILEGELALAHSNIDGYVIFFRIYHDCFVFDNKVQGIYVHVGGYSAVKISDFNIGLNADGLVVSILEQPAGLLTPVYLTTRVTLPSVGNAWVTDLTTDTGVAEGFAFTAAGTYYLVGVQNGKVIAVKDLVITGAQGAFNYTVTDHA